MDTIAIIGASVGQRKLFVKAKELGFRTIAFAWEQGASSKDLADRFYPISIMETEEIIRVCNKENVIGVVSNCSDVTAEAVSKITTKMGLRGIPYDSFLKMKNKYAMREMTSDIEELSQIWSFRYCGELPSSYPCIVKPCTGASKKGVCFVYNESQFQEAINYAKDATDGDIVVEEFIVGQEVSVESISYEGHHTVVQITDKESTGAPHFVEIGHHQPSLLPEETKNKIKRVVCRILDKLNFGTGASHIEMKVTSSGDVYLIEVNPRGGGDEISNTLVEMSTGYDYVKSMVEAASGCFTTPNVKDIAFAGIYYLCAQTRERIDFFKNADDKKWLIEKDVKTYDLSEGTSNYDRNGYLIYCDEKKIII